MARESRRRTDPRSRKRHKPEEIVSKLRQVDVLVSQGQTVADAIRAIGVTEVDHYRELATALQYSPAACVSGLPTAGPGGVRARLRGLARSAHPTSFPGQKPRSAKTNPALIPARADPHALAQSRRPMDMMSQGWSMRRFQASQQ